MPLRPQWLVAVLLCLGCQVMPALPPPPVAADNEPELPVPNQLLQAAAFLEQNDADSACDELASYLTRHPRQHLVRMRYAELLLRRERLAEARAEYERCIADAQDQTGATGRPLVHCHRRLMEIAELTGDAYGEHLHRGIGVYLLACERAALPDLDGQMPAEGLLFKAAAELILARSERDGEARPCWYLFEVWSCLAQRQEAQRWLRRADEAAAFTYLSPAEQRRLHLACWQTAGPHDDLRR